LRRWLSCDAGVVALLLSEIFLVAKFDSWRWPTSIVMWSERPHRPT